jgi:hypothetical protein
MRGSLYSTWYRYSLIFQAGALTLGWAWVVLWLAAMEYHTGDYAPLLLAIMALGLFIVGSVITLAWPGYLICGIRNRRIPWFLTGLWMLFGFIQAPLGPFLAAFQIWCLWKLHQQSPIHTRTLYDSPPPSE